MDATETKPTARVGIVTAGDIVTAYPLPDGKPTEAMTAHYLACIASNLDAGRLIVTPERWRRIKAALSEIDADGDEPVKVQDFTAEATEETLTP